MHTARRTFVATGTVAILAAAAVTAAIDADTLDGKHASEFALTSDLDDAVQPGPQGPGGPEGPAGVSGYDHVHELHEVTGGDFELIAVSCPGEKLPLSGGTRSPVGAPASATTTSSSIQAGTWHTGWASTQAPAEARRSPST